MNRRLRNNYRLRLSATWILAILGMCCSQSVVATPASKGKISQASDNQLKKINFLTSYSCGKIWLCPNNWQAKGDLPEAFGKESKSYKFLGDARGELNVHENDVLKLRPSIDLLRDPTLLKSVPLENFEFLDLSGADFDENTLKVIAAFPNLKRLECNMCDLTDDLLGRMVVSPGLEALFLPATPITGTTLAHFSTLKSLKALGLASVYLKPDAYKQIGSLSNITKLDLSKTSVRDEDLAALLSKLPHLRNLALKSCAKLTSAAAAPLAKAPQLYSVDVINTRVTYKSIRDAETRSHKIAVIEAFSGGPVFSVPEAEKIFHPLP